MEIAGYALDLLVVGFPGKSVCHGGMGWSTIALLRGHGRVALIDTGPMGMRKVLIERLRAHGHAPADVTDVLLTHSHHDHTINWVLFPNARIAIGARELAWSLEQPWGETPVPELYMRELASSPRVDRLADGAQALPHLRAHAAPGHTPGHLFFVLEDEDRDVLFVGDAAKTRAELASRRCEATLDSDASAATVERIWSCWSRKPGSIVVPGHDVPLLQRDGRIEYMQRHQAAVKANFGDDPEAFEIIDLTGAISRAGETAR
ncbi:metallo-beta-lactamase [Bordetella sp. H567]|uniref:MBL fold metallo-hydrolase n=1 Tax=Bordetella sp. H567 TaxID=1697043 RepID=UPI00081C546D|nr:MBL fold metallo-hydrolase [Bordetella sp. H567]AOB31343.1 metallo-beta-lactamase [Bordetella sp. H567]